VGKGQILNRSKRQADRAGATARVEQYNTRILDFNQEWIFFFKPRWITCTVVRARIKRVMTTSTIGSLVDLFKPVIDFQRTFEAK